MSHEQAEPVHLGIEAPGEFIDVHAHLADPVFDVDRAAVLERARAAGVVAILCVGETLADAARIVELARDFPLLRPCAGLYPTHWTSPPSARWQPSSASIGSRSPRSARSGSITGR